jgi:hypothetical protein
MWASSPTRLPLVSVGAAICRPHNPPCQRRGDRREAVGGFVSAQADTSRTARRNPHCGAVGACTTLALPSDSASPRMYNFRLPNQRFGASGMSGRVARRKARREGSLCPQQGVPSPPYKVAIRLCEHRLSPCRNLRFRHPPRQRGTRRTTPFSSVDVGRCLGAAAFS